MPAQEDNLLARDELLLEQARCGSRDALQNLFDHYCAAVLFVVRRRLHMPLRRLLDSVDIMQEVQLTLTEQPVPADALESPRAFMRFVCGIAKHKLADARRYHAAERRSLQREVPLDSVPADDLPAVDPCQELDEVETWQRLEQELPPVYRAIVRLRRAGKTQVEIAAHLGIGERTVRRVLSKLKPILTPPRRMLEPLMGQA
jgi:RNA polymerase sigma factor (sigma-70 family)